MNFWNNFECCADLGYDKRDSGNKLVIWLVVLEPLVMSDEEAELYNLLEECLNKFPTDAVITTHRLKHERTENGHRGAWAEQSALSLVFQPPKASGVAMQQFLERHYPNHLGLVGTVFGGTRLDGESLLRWIVGRYFENNFSLEVSETAIRSLSLEVLDFFHQSEIQVRFNIPVINLKMDLEITEIVLTKDLVLRYLSDKEFSEFYGPRIEMAGAQPNLYHFHLPDWVLTGTFSTPKQLTFENKASSKDPLTEINGKIRLAIDAIRTFKGGSVNYAEVRLDSDKFYYGALGGRITFAPPPQGPPINISSTELADFKKHIAFVFSPMHSSLRSALQKLSEAEDRRSAADQLLDAAIGLEIILLHGLKDELTYRFCMNYSAMSDNCDDRLNAFEIAKKVYNLRSQIAHGSILFETIQSNPEHCQSAVDACAMLRNAIRYFSSDAANPAFVRPDFWKKKLLCNC